MSQVDKPLLLRCLVALLRPVASFCLRRTIYLQDIVECLKAALIEQAVSDLKKRGEKSNVSRISVMTGVHRREVQRLLDGGMETTQSRDVITKVVGQWRQDKRFTTKAGQPRVLTFGENSSQFHELVGTVSQDVNPGTVLFELLRVKAVEETRNGLRLAVQSYVPKGDVVSGFSILAADTEDLTRAVEENVLGDDAVPHLHARTSYDSVRADALPEIKHWLLKEGHQFHGKVRDYVSSFDQDINPDATYTGKRATVVLGSFSRVEQDEE